MDGQVVTRSRVVACAQCSEPIGDGPYTVFEFSNRPWIRATHDGCADAYELEFGADAEGWE